jgi:YVTN family beta-propeller protein
MTRAALAAPKPGRQPARMIRRTPALLVLCSLAACSGAPTPAPDDFEVVAQLDIGQNPHQISFSEDGRTAYVATAGEDRITVVDAVRYAIAGTIPVPGTPLGVVPTPNGTDLAVARFQSGGVARYARSGSPLGGDRGTSAGASLIVGPFGADRYLVSIEQADSVHVFDAAAFTFEASYPTGTRPFPGAATSDGRLVFVPAYEDGTVTVIDLFNDRILETVAVGANPSGGAVLPGDEDYAVVVRAENRVVFINTASHQVVGELTEGIGESPFSLVVTPNGRLAFVNNTASHDISVIDLATRQVIERIPVPDVPIVMAVHPSGEELWVSSEGVHRLTVISIPGSFRDDPSNLPATAAPDTPGTEVAVMGMIHSEHRTSERWGLPQVEATIRAFEPDVVCAEIAPDRWRRIDQDLRERDTIEDPRVLRFPEYTDLILRLSVSMGFEVVPCAGWTLEMSDLRNTRIAEFESESRWAGPRAEYARRLAELRRSMGEPSAAPDDPAYIHSDEYNERQKAELELYDEYQNDMIGPGGWTNINVEHYRLVDRTIRDHSGERILVTFGGGHKYWLLEQLRGRRDIELMDLGAFLPK